MVVGEALLSRDSHARFSEAKRPIFRRLGEQGGEGKFLAESVTQSNICAHVPHFPQLSFAFEVVF